MSRLICFLPEQLNPVFTIGFRINQSVDLNWQIHAFLSMPLDGREKYFQKINTAEAPQTNTVGEFLKYFMLISIINGHNFIYFSRFKTK